MVSTTTPASVAHLRKQAIALALHYLRPSSPWVWTLSAPFASFSCPCTSLKRVVGFTRRISTSAYVFCNSHYHRRSVVCKIRHSEAWISQSELSKGGNAFRWMIVYIPWHRASLQLSRWLVMVASTRLLVPDTQAWCWPTLKVGGKLREQIYKWPAQRSIVKQYL